MKAFRGLLSFVFWAGFFASASAGDMPTYVTVSTQNGVPNINMNAFGRLVADLRVETPSPSEKVYRFAANTGAEITELRLFHRADGLVSQVTISVGGVDYTYDVTDERGTDVAYAVVPKFEAAGSGFESMWGAGIIEQEIRNVDFSFELNWYGGNECKEYGARALQAYMEIFRDRDLNNDKRYHYFRVMEQVARLTVMTKLLEDLNCF